jgi:signal transduction histidine kinase
MKLKDRLALYFTLISTGTLAAVLVVVYFIFVKFLESDFYDRLNDRAFINAKLYLEADEISTDSLKAVKTEYLETLHDEVVRIYDDQNKARFIKDHQQFWTNDVINIARKHKKIKFKEGLRQTVGIYYKDNQGNFVILASAIDKSTHARIGKLRISMLFTFIAIVIGLLLSARWIADKILKPLNKFITDVKLVKSNNLDFRVKEGRSKDEISLLAQNFNQLLDHLEQAFILQKTFVANVSHELRTPITSLLMEAEIALQQTRSTDDYQKALRSIIEDTDKMNQMINGLINLAKADLELGSLQSDVIKLDEMLVDLKNYWNKKHGNGPKLHLNIGNVNNAKDLNINFNRSLLEIAINNIIGNAFKFSNQKDVYVSLHSSSDEVAITIQDFGIGIPPQNNEFIYQPFFTTSAEEDKQGNGLGLYIAHKIITLAKGYLSFKSDENGTTFWMRWKF